MSVGLKAYPARGVVHGKAMSALVASEFFFLPFIKINQHGGQGGEVIRTLAPIAGCIILPVVVPHGESSGLEWLDTACYGNRHDFNYGQSGLGEYLYLVH